MVSFLTFFSGCKKMMYIFGVKRHTRATLALRLIGVRERQTERKRDRE